MLFPARLQIKNANTYGADTLRMYLRFLLYKQVRFVKTKTERNATMSQFKNHSINTKLIHGGISSDEATGSVNIPIYQTSTFKQEIPGVHKGYEYSRTGNPTREALENLIAELEEGIAGFAFASGLAAITVVLSLFRAGDKLVVSDNVYGGTFRVMDKVFQNFGIEYILVDTTDSEKIEAAID